jgi:hypothetical protein
MNVGFKSFGCGSLVVEQNPKNVPQLGPIETFRANWKGWSVTAIINQKMLTALSKRSDSIYCQPPTFMNQISR